MENLARIFVACTGFTLTMLNILTIVIGVAVLMVVPNDILTFEIANRSLIKLVKS